jgi:hypothetical protein
VAAISKSQGKVIKKYDIVGVRLGVFSAFLETNAL